MHDLDFKKSGKSVMIISLNNIKRCLFLPHWLYAYFMLDTAKPIYRKINFCCWYVLTKIRNTFFSDIWIGFDSSKMKMSRDFLKVGWILKLFDSFLSTVWVSVLSGRKTVGENHLCIIIIICDVWQPNKTPNFLLCKSEDDHRYLVGF